MRYVDSELMQKLLDGLPEFVDESDTDTVCPWCSESAPFHKPTCEYGQFKNQGKTKIDATKTQYIAIPTEAAVCPVCGGSVKVKTSESSWPYFEVYCTDERGVPGWHCPHREHMADIPSWKKENFDATKWLRANYWFVRNKDG